MSQVLSELEGAQAEGDQRLVKRCLEALDSLLRNSEALASKVRTRCPAAPCAPLLPEMCCRAGHNAAPTTSQWPPH